MRRRGGGESGEINSLPPTLPVAAQCFCNLATLATVIVFVVSRENVTFYQNDTEQSKCHRRPQHLRLAPFFLLSAASSLPISTRANLLAPRTHDRSIARSIDCIAFFAAAAAAAALSLSRIDCRLIKQKCTHDDAVDDDKRKRRRGLRI